MSQDDTLNDLALKVCGTASNNLVEYGELVTVLIVFGTKGGDTLRFTGANNQLKGVLNDANAEMKEQMTRLLKDTSESISSNDGHTIVFVSESNYQNKDIKAFTVTASNRSGAVTYVILYKIIDGIVRVNHPSKLDDVLNGWISAVWEYV